MHDLMSNLEKFDEPNPSKEQRRLLMKKVNDDEDIYIIVPLQKKHLRRYIYIKILL